MTFRKYRAADDFYEIGFNAQIDSDETLTSAVVAVQRNMLLQWSDVSAQFIEDPATISPDAKAARLQLLAASVDRPQPAGAYRVVATVVSSKGRRLVASVPLFVKS